MSKRKQQSILNYFNSDEKNSRHQFEVEKHTLNNSKKVKDHLPQSEMGIQIHSLRIHYF